MKFDINSLDHQQIDLTNTNVYNSWNSEFYKIYAVVYLSYTNIDPSFQIGAASNKDDAIKRRLLTVLFSDESLHDCERFKTKIIYSIHRIVVGLTMLHSSFQSALDTKNIDRIGTILQLYKTLDDKLFKQLRDMKTSPYIAEFYTNQLFSIRDEHEITEMYERLQKRANIRNANEDI